MRGLWRALGTFAGQRRAWRVPVDLAMRAAWLAARRALGPRRFIAGGRRYAYLVHPYVLDNERAVEIPIALAELDAAIERARRAGRRLRVLEVGNVLSTYADLHRRGAAGGEAVVEEHVVLDKYEDAPGVLNIDIVDYRAERPFDLVLSISTLEHVGRDETPRDDGKAPRALGLLRNLLTPAGRGLVTFPVGYHPQLDAALRAHTLDVDELTCLERRDRFRNRWRETEVAGVLARRYGAPFPCANGVVVARFSGR